MAVIETWLMQDLKKPVPVQQLCGNFFSHNGNANRIGVRVYNGDSPATLSGTVSGYAVLTDGTTVPCTGSLSGNEASILLPAAAYVPGNIFITIMLTSGTTITTLAALAGNVVRARTDSQVDPGSVVTDWTNTINAALQTVENYTGNIIATPYASLTYPVPLGKYCIYNNLLYRCVSPIASSENWTASHWTQTKLADDVSDLKSAINGIREHTKNLFEPENILNAYFTASSAYVKSNDNCALVYIPCEASKTYTVSKTAGTRFAVGYTKALPVAGANSSTGTAIYGIEVDYTASSISITTGSDAEYIVAWVFNGGSDTGTRSAMLASVQIEEGSTATSYEPPYSAIDRILRNVAFTNLGVLDSGTDLNTIKGNAGYYILSVNGSYNNAPVGTGHRRFLFCCPFGSNSALQILFNSTDGIVYQRIYVPSSWSDWKQTVDSELFEVLSNSAVKYIEILESGTDLNDVKTKNGYYVLGVSSSYDNCPVGTDHRRYLICLKYEQSSVIQIILNTTDGVIYQRVYTSNAWSNWKSSQDKLLANYGTLPNTTPSTDLNTLYGKDAFYTMGINSTYEHDPIGSGKRRLLVCYTSGGTFTHQIMFNSSNGNIFQRVYASGSWSDWKQTASNDVNLTDGSAEQVRFPLNATYGGSSNPYSPYEYHQKVVTLLHFSDIHEASKCLSTLMYWANENTDLYDDILCTGDLVNYYNESTGTDYMAYWKAIKNTENVLVTIGNHDAKNQGSSGSGAWERKTLARSRELYMYGIENWGVTSPAGTTWWYKDYENSDLRLIGLDTTVVENGDADAAQQTWLTNLLADSITNGKTVVIAQHYQPYVNTTKVSCDFTADNRNPLNQESLQMPSAYYGIVQNFINNNGKFVCWLAGHQHCDFVLYNSSYPDQIFFVVTSLWNDLRLSDQARTEGLRSFVAANLIGFDTERKLIKISRVGANYDFNMRPRNVLVYNYETKTIVRQSSGMN